MKHLLAVLALLSCSGCAAILGSKQKDFNLQSNPSGADVYLNGNRLGSTPVQVKLSNTATHTFVFKRAGYADATCTLNRGTGGGWVVLDVLFGLVPIVIDAATNAWSQTKGDSCAPMLESVGPTPEAAAALERPVPPKPAPQPALADDVPTGTNFVLNKTTKRYYAVGCPVLAQFDATQLLYYRSETALQAAGFQRGTEC